MLQILLGFETAGDIFSARAKKVQKNAVTVLPKKGVWVTLSRKNSHEASLEEGGGTLRILLLPSRFGGTVCPPLEIAPLQHKTLRTEEFGRRKQKFGLVSRKKHRRISSPELTYAQLNLRTGGTSSTSYSPKKTKSVPMQVTGARD